MSTARTTAPNTSLHYRYWIGILVAVSVELAAAAFAKVPGVGAYLNFALTVGSLLLSGLAIVYAFVSNASITQNLGALNQASSDLTTAASIVTDATAQLSTQAEAIPRELGAKMDRAVALAEDQASISKSVASRLESMAQQSLAASSAMSQSRTEGELPSDLIVSNLIAGAGPLLHLVYLLIILAAENGYSTRVVGAKVLTPLLKPTGKGWNTRHLMSFGMYIASNIQFHSLGILTTSGGTTSVAPALEQRREELIASLRIRPLDWFNVDALLIRVEEANAEVKMETEPDVEGQPAES